jgi:tRNA(Ile)-lysidine synthase
MLEDDPISEGDAAPISDQEATRLFAGWEAAPAIILAVSGGPDSIALMVLAARWRRKQKSGPRLIVITVDHGLRPEAAREARQVKQLARTLDLPHRTLRWSGPKPKTGLPAAARDARYRLLLKAAGAAGATHILTAHTRDDQAETFLMRMSRGSGMSGLAAMARQSEREGLVHGRPFLPVAKSRLVATLTKARIGFAVDPTNHDTSFTRPRFRALMPALAAEGCDSRNLARLAARLARANSALEILVDGAERFLALKDPVLQDRATAPRKSAASRAGANASDIRSFDAEAFAALSEEIRLRLLLRAIARVGHEGPAELGKVETLLAALDHAATENPANRRIRLKQTLAGALVSLNQDRLRIEPAPQRRGRAKLP